MYEFFVNNKHDIYLSFLANFTTTHRVVPKCYFEGILKICYLIEQGLILIKHLWGTSKERSYLFVPLDICRFVEFLFACH